MFAVQCSFCQHDNIPGARFCAECGSPLHLRVCPNPKCGKVSDVNTIHCEFCGTPFPKIPLAEAGGSPGTTPSADRDQVETSGDAQSAATQKASISAWPLIAVAIVAGGLPLLWFNRHSLPTPKTWQNSPEVERLIAPPVLPPPAVPQNHGATPLRPSTQEADGLALPPLSPPIQPVQAEKVESAKSAQQAHQELAATQEKAAENRQAAHDAPKTKQETDARKSKIAAEAEEPSQPQRPCTEAAAALGLCAPKPAGK
jgi:hypothetical protein